MYPDLRAFLYFTGHFAPVWKKRSVRSPLHGEKLSDCALDSFSQIVPPQQAGAVRQKENNRESGDNDPAAFIVNQMEEPTEPQHVPCHTGVSRLNQFSALPGAMA